jgi:4-azaleucine resistance transporter AzlC
MAHAVVRVYARLARALQRRMPAPARAEFLGGFKAVLPFLFGTLPFGMVVGVATVGIGLSRVEAVLMTTLVFAGSAQIAALPLIVAGAPVAIIVLTAFVINLRFVIYSAAMAPHFSHLSKKWRLLLGYFLTDTGFALSTRHFLKRPHDPFKHWFYLGGGMTIACTWLSGAYLGILLGAAIPKAWMLDFAATLTMLGLLAPYLRAKPELLAALASGGVALAARGLPMRLGLVAGVVAGIAVGVLAAKLSAPSSEKGVPENTHEKAVSEGLSTAEEAQK